LRIVFDGIYDFLFEVLNVEKSVENKNLIINWLDNKKEIIVIYKVLKEPNDSSSKVELREY
jgi:CRISPR-associated protein dxTHG motif protein